MQELITQKRDRKKGAYKIFEDKKQRVSATLSFECVRYIHRLAKLRGSDFSKALDRLIWVCIHEDHNEVGMLIKEKKLDLENWVHVGKVRYIKEANK